MKKNGLYLCFIGLFLALCLTLSLGIVFAGPALPGANEQLQKTPALTDRQGNFNDNYFTDVAAWVNDHFFPRQTLISANHSLNAKLFGVSGEDSVIVGTDGWLYFGATLDNYTGIHGLSDRELYAMAQNLSMMAQYCQKNGKQFAFLIAPNKNSLYPAHMPDFGATAENPDSQKLLNQLQELDVPTVDLFTVFGNIPEVLYYATDSHWHSRGAALAADTVNAAFGVTTSFYDGPFTNAENPYAGDLYTMLYPAFTGWEADPIYAGNLDFAYTGNTTKPDAITLTTESSAPGTILVYRDSFGNLLHPFLAASYGSARFSRSNQYDLTGDSEYVLVELVERNLSYLLKYVPIMQCPTEDVLLPEASGSVEIAANPKDKAPEGYVLWTGTAAANIDPNSAVYVQSGDLIYRAFLTENNGFAVYLPADAAPSCVAWYANGSLKSHTPN